MPPDRRTTRTALVTVVGLLALQALVLLAFVVPGHAPEPHDVPIAVVAPPAGVDDVARALPSGAFAVRAVADERAARAAIADREVYGALVPRADGGGRLLVAPAASPAVAQLLERSLGARPGVAVEDVAPLDPDDPRGATLNLLLLPLVVVCLPAALLLGRLPTTVAGAGGAAALFAALGGLLVVGLVSGVLGALPGPWLALAGVAALAILAIALPALGAARLLGPPGVGLAALVFFLVGNPGSGAAAAPELLPGFWRAVGPLLPPGAAVDALRGTASFDGAGAGDALLVLGAWALSGVALLAVARRREAARAQAPAQGNRGSGLLAQVSPAGAGR